MDKAAPPRRPGHAHEQHLVVVRQCDCCARWIVLCGQVVHVAGYHDEGNARADAAQLLRNITGHPDPRPVLVVVADDGSAESVPPELAIAASDGPMP